MSEVGFIIDLNIPLSDEHMLTAAYSGCKSSVSAVATWFSAAVSPEPSFLEIDREVWTCDSIVHDHDVFFNSIPPVLVENPQ